MRRSNAASGNNNTAGQRLYAAVFVVAHIGCSTSSRTLSATQQHAPPAQTSHTVATTDAFSGHTLTPRPTASGAESNATTSTEATTQGCPNEMVLVDGDYCKNLEVRCVKQWHAPQNHLWVCERVQKPTRCLSDTRAMRYCIDRFEFPNRKGARPMVMQNFYQAQLHCSLQNKRLCTESEWTKACEGPDNKPFPYGYERDPKKCHGDQPWDHPNKALVTASDPGELERLWQGVVSGQSAECVSDYGVHDMPGNADELAASESYNKGPKSNFDNVTTGGPWYRGVRNMCRPKIYSHNESFAYYYLSWRCCKEADGKPTDPRTPKQVKRAIDFKRIIWLAHHSWKLPFRPLSAE